MFSVLHSLLNVDPALLTEVLEGLDRPQAVARVCKSMAPAVNYALHDWIQPSGSALLDPIRRSFETRFGKVDVENAAAVNLRARNIRNTAIATIRKAAPLLKQGEWVQAGIDPSAPKEKDFDRIHAMIRTRRAQNLIGFFEWMGTQEGMEPVREFVDSLSIDLSLLGKARAIRAWLAAEGNAALLDGIVEIPMGTIFPGEANDRKQGIPVEILKLRGPTIETLKNLFLLAVGQQNLEVVQAFLADERFLQFEGDAIGFAIRTAAVKHFWDIVLALISCARFEEIPVDDLGKALYTAAEQGELEIVQALLSVFIAKEMQGAIPPEFYGGGLLRAIEGGDVDMIRTLLPYLAETQDVLNRAVEGGRREIVEVLIGSPKMEAVSDNEFGQAFVTAVRDEHTAIALILMNCANFARIPVHNLRQALIAAVNNGYTGIVFALMEDERFGQISVNHLQEALTMAVHHGYTGIADTLIRRVGHRMGADLLGRLVGEAAEGGLASTVRAFLATGRISFVNAVKAYKRSSGAAVSELESYLAPREAFGNMIGAWLATRLARMMLSSLKL